MISCGQPGCTGTIVDGYCDVCGSPGAPATPPLNADAVTSTVATAPVLPPTADGARCTQPGCTGTVVDGYCDVCGTPAAAGPPPAESPVTAALAGAGSTVTRGSSRLGSTALGSTRTATGGSKVTKRVNSGSARLRTARLGAGLTRVPPAPVIDAAQAVMKNPEVPEEKRTCPSCGAPVGRSRNGQPGRSEGFCAKCGSQYSFTPKLKAGDLVANQYEVAGCLAHGGLGWIYLARDRNVSDRWVVLKGLLNTGDKDALAVAIVERQFLAQVEHPLIVEIYNFVTHDEAGYIVMEYVGGLSLKQILKQRMRAHGGTFDPLPVDQALAYILEVLPAFQYLHDLGLAYCDFKPDNLIQVGDAVKLIDLGGVRRIDDQESAIYGTVGYQAPEVAQVGTTIASDIYTIGRTLVVLMTEFRGYQTKYVASLPPVAETPLFQRARLALPADRQGLRPGPGGPVRLDRRAPGPAARGAARGGRGEDGGDRPHLGGLGAVRGAGHRQRGAGVARAARPAPGHLRPPVLLAVQRLSREPPRPVRRAAQGAGAVGGGPAGPGQGGAADAAARPRRADRQRDARRRPLGVAGGVDQRSGRAAVRRLRRRPGGVQRGLRSGARRARPQAGPGAGLRARRRG